MRRLAVLMLALVVGCGQRNPTAEEFIPPEDVVQSALDRCLGAWAKGESTSPVAGTYPPIHLIDGLRTKERKLLKYEILGPTPADAARCIAVRLTLGNPSQEIRERYVVVGIDPIWVWRLDDYVMLTHWNHPMTADKAKR